MDRVMIIQDSVAPHGIRLTTFKISIPKPLNAQFVKHRDFSINSGSSRAIPTKRLLRQISEDLVLPPVVGINCAGMSPEEYLDEGDTEEFHKRVRELFDLVGEWVVRAERDLNVHKQTLNRYLESFYYQDVVITSTFTKNFFDLRITDGAQNYTMSIAKEMKRLMESSVPQELHPGQWHIPYILGEEESLDTETKLKVSVARCARVSYKAFDSDSPSSVESDVMLYDKLSNSGHWSPFEHQAMSIASPVRILNFKGWLQHRAMVDTFSYEKGT